MRGESSRSRHIAGHIGGFFVQYGNEALQDPLKGWNSMEKSEAQMIADHLNDEARKAARPFVLVHASLSEAEFDQVARRQMQQYHDDLKAKATAEGRQLDDDEALLIDAHWRAMWHEWRLISRTGGTAGSRSV